MTRMCQQVWEILVEAGYGGEKGKKRKAEKID
jgi:hypothetical protein